MSETLHEAAQAFLEHLRAQGKTERTLYTYGKDFEQIDLAQGEQALLDDVLDLVRGVLLDEHRRRFGGLNLDAGVVLAQVFGD